MESKTREHMYKISPSAQQTACLGVNSASAAKLSRKLSLDCRLKINVKFHTDR